MLKGSCLCGGIRFQFEGPRSGIGFCHCSLCRKVSGVGSTARVVIAFDQLTWIAGKELVTLYERPSGYGVAFCRVCGSPAPDTNPGQTVYTIPVGLLDDDPALEIADHSHIGSKAQWEIIGDDAPRFEGDDGPPRERKYTA